MDHPAQNELNSLLQDNLRGATTIYTDALELFIRYSSQSNLSFVQQGSRLLAKRFNMMGLFVNLSRTIEQTRIEDQLSAALDQCLVQVRKSRTKIKTVGAAALSGVENVVTISSSSLVAGVLIEINKSGNDLSVNCMRSGPGNEGEIFAQHLAGSGLNTTVFADDDMHDTVASADAVISGCDLISDRFFINKASTAKLRLSALKQSKPFRVVSDLNRLVKGYPEDSVLNPLFERIYMESIVDFITEKGVMSSDKIRMIHSDN